MSLSNAPLGHAVAYPSEYDASLLFPIAREEARAALALPAHAPLPFIGADHWNAYELSWLDLRGKPQVAMAHLRVGADTPHIIESKSLKLYLNSFNQTRLFSAEAMHALLMTDLARAAGGPVAVDLILPRQFATQALSEPIGACLDNQDIDIDLYTPDADLLRCADPAQTVSESLYSNLLKSNCPVTGQPDWASIVIDYQGPAIDHAALLRYLVSFRMHADFHEHCVERIYLDIMRRCRPTQLRVDARYTRRGGLDINPWRATPGYKAPSSLRTARQ